MTVEEVNKARRELLTKLRRDIQTEQGRVTSLRESLAESEGYLKAMQEHYASLWVAINHAE